MVSAVDTSILLDLWAHDSSVALRALLPIKACVEAGPTGLSVVVYAEVAGRFSDRQELDRILELLHLEVWPLAAQECFLAGRFLQEYRHRGGSRLRILADFLIAAQAQTHGARLMTRDGRFFGEAFPALTAVHPDELATAP